MSLSRRRLQMSVPDVLRSTLELLALLELVGCRVQLLISGTSGVGLNGQFRVRPNL